MIFKLIKSRSGFTLVEMLIVIIVLGILAIIVVPQVAVSTDDAKLKTLLTNLSTLESAIEIYHVQHNQTYPGVHDIAGAAGPTADAAETAFVQQLTQYTDINGVVSATKDATYKYGPYIKGGALPTNPFNNSSAVMCDVTETDITVKAKTASMYENLGWKFYTRTGNLLANHE